MLHDFTGDYAIELSVIFNIIYVSQLKLLYSLYIVRQSLVKQQALIGKINRLSGGENIQKFQRKL